MFGKPAQPDGGTYAIVMPEDTKLKGLAAQLDKKMKGGLERAIAAGRFTGGKGQTLEVLVPAGLECERLLVLGLGKAADISPVSYEAAGGALSARLLTSGDKTVVLNLEVPEKSTVPAAEAAARIGLGAQLRAYRFDNYRTTQKKTEKPTLTKVTVLTEDQAEAKRLWKSLEALSSGIKFTRDLVTEPPNILYPAEFAKRAQALEDLGVSVEILGVKEMTKLGMGALLGVAQGSVRPARILAMRWNGTGKANVKPLCLVGKGVTFDTGGISLKPAAGMEDMKWDMGGAGAVAGAMKALAGRKAKANVVGVIGLVENMPDG
ncbi:MAG TPA: leucyl aminopeptidase, partial [Alphaproteobacteria bacterium]|nr:leucyl aminopeptidase [Alphaproteobacteria bacterium]